MLVLAGAALAVLLITARRRARSRRRSSSEPTVIDIGHVDMPSKPRDPHTGRTERGWL